MKKAHIYNFIILLIAYAIPYLINQYYPFENETIAKLLQLLVPIGVFTVVLLPILYYLVNRVFNLFIKHNKKVKLWFPRLLTFILTLGTTFTFIYFYIEYYFYFGSILILYLMYFIFLYIIDLRYVHVSVENKIQVNDELVNQFLNLLGGKENIVNVSYESSRLRVEVKQIKMVDLDKIKALGAQGIFVAGNKLQAIVGNNASELENSIKKYLTIV